MVSTAIQIRDSARRDESLKHPEFFNSPGKRTAVLALLLFLLTLVAYNPVTQNGFVGFDDPSYITNNRHVQAGLSWTTLKWAFRSTDAANWHPVTWLSHALDYQIFGLRPAGHHYVTVLLHAITALLLFLFLQAATGFCWRSFIVASLFAVHPVNVESVAWAAERKSVLCMLFFVLMLMAYRRYVIHPDWKRYSGVLLCFALALMSKAMVVTAPFLLLLLDYWPFERSKTISPSRLIREKMPLLAMSAASCIVTMAAQRSGGAVHSEEFSLASRTSNAVVAYWRYIGKAFWPTDLAAFYPHTDKLPAWEVVFATALLLLVSASALTIRRKGYPLVGWLWFLGTLVPVIGLVQVGEQAMADRYAYLPFIGLFVAVVWGVADLARAKHWNSAYLSLGVCAIVVALSLLTYRQVGYWQNTKILWTHAVAVTGPNYMAEDSLGSAMMGEEKIGEAKRHFERAVAINPLDGFGLVNLGVTDKLTGDVAGAVQNYEAAIRSTSDKNLQATALGNLGSVYRMTGDLVRARAYYESALQLVPDYNLALTSLGLMAEKAGDMTQAINYFERAVDSSPTDMQYLLLSQALARGGRQSEAQQVFNKAKSISQNWDAAVGGVDYLLRQNGIATAAP